jgi:hypothetical protein
MGPESPLKVRSGSFEFTGCIITPPGIYAVPRLRRKGGGGEHQQKCGQDM